MFQASVRKGRRRKLSLSLGTVHLVATLFLYFNFLELTRMSFELINDHLFFCALKAWAKRK